MKYMRGIFAIVQANRPYNNQRTESQHAREEEEKMGGTWGMSTENSRNKAGYGETTSQISRVLGVNATATGPHETPFMKGVCQQRVRSRRG